jgi:hypothetical protein
MMMLMMMMTMMIINQSVFINSKSAYYKASTKTQIQHKKAHIHKTNTKQTNKEYNIILYEKIYKSTGAKPLNSEETKIS